MEFHPDTETACGRPFPVEYKRGRPKKHHVDRVQLCAQALCLEEMLGHAGPGRRPVLRTDSPAARGAVRRAAASAHPRHSETAPRPDRLTAHSRRCTGAQVRQLFAAEYLPARPARARGLKPIAAERAFEVSRLPLARGLKLANDGVGFRLVAPARARGLKCREDRE